MSLATRISSFVIPALVWEEGYSALPKLPPMALVVRDALAIERRSSKEVNLSNEQRRYTLCCERMQGIAEELFYGSDALQPPLVWPAESTDKMPCARAYLAVVETILPWMRKHLSKDEMNNVVYSRFPFVFFPPDHTASYLAQYEFLSRHAEIDSLFEFAARVSNIKDSPLFISPTECKRAFDLRLEILRRVAGQDWGLVDVVEII